MSDREETLVKYFTRPAIMKLARKAGVKSLSEDCYRLIDSILASRIEQLVKDGLLVHKFRGAKVLTCNDIQEAAKLRGYFYADGDELKSGRVTTGK